MKPFTNMKVHRAKAHVGAALVVALSAGLAWGSASLMIDAVQSVRAEAAWRDTLIAASKKSEAHRYFVYNWMQCRPLVSSQAGCFASIRTAAAARGPGFVRQVDGVARELGVL